MPFAPILAAVDVCGATFVAGIVVMFLFWVLRIFAKAQEQANPPSVRPRRGDRDRQRDEIEEFTRQQTSRRRGRDEDFLEVVEDPRPRRQGQSRPRPAAQRPPQRPPQPAQAPPSRPRPGESLASRHATQSDSLGSGVRSHLATYMDDRIDQSVQQHLIRAVGQSVQDHLGASGSAADPARSAEHPIVRLLRDPNGVKTALILNEVLTRRKRGGSRD